MPFWHESHAGCPSTDENRPAAHFVQLLLPLVKLDCQPARHLMQLAAPAAGVYSPTAHSAHFACPMLLPYRPAAHATQLC